MAFGQDNRGPAERLCLVCRQRCKGVTTGMVGGVGFGSSGSKRGLVTACINPGCAEGRKNIAQDVPSKE